MHPCITVKDGIYQSPIALAQTKDIFYTFKNLENIDDFIHYIFNKKTTEYDVKNNVEITSNGLTYKLSEFHFHQPGEHTIEGKDYPLEMHFEFVHNKSLFVIGFLVKLFDKTSDIFLKIIDNDPFRFPSYDNFFTYPGSLTGDGFNGNVNWVVTDRILYITPCDLKIITKKSKGTRGIQPRDGRIINYVCQHKH